MSRVWSGIFGAVVLACAAPVWAQYPGRINTSQANSGPRLRATAVLEYTGTLKHIKASRLVPIAVWDGRHYEPAGLYLAQPAPLAVQGGTQYELERDGRSEGFFNLSGAEQTTYGWVGVGKFQAPLTEMAQMKKPSATDVYRVRYGNTSSKPGEPHFAHVPADDRTPKGNKAGKDSGPTLHRRNESGPPTNRIAVDPNRPRFGSEPSSDDETRTPRVAIDPNRPLLSYGSSKPKAEKPEALMGFPPDMKQMVAVSEAGPLSTQTFGYSWANPNDAAKMQADLELVAERAIAATVPAVQAELEAASGGKDRKAGRRGARPSAKRPEAPKAPVLTDEHFRVYGLSMGGGATMVLTARTSLKDPVYGGRYVTIVAQPDFYGNPQILLQHVASINDLDLMPRMKLIGPVDAQGNGRGDLLFELRGKTYRRFAIYSITGGEATQVFITQPAMI